MFCNFTYKKEGEIGCSLFIDAGTRPRCYLKIVSWVSLVSLAAQVALSIRSSISKAASFSVALGRSCFVFVAEGSSPQMPPMMLGQRIFFSHLHRPRFCCRLFVAFFFKKCWRWHYGPFKEYSLCSLEKWEEMEPANSAFLIVFWCRAWEFCKELSWNKTKVFTCKKTFPSSFSSMNPTESHFIQKYKIHVYTENVCWIRKKATNR